MELFGRQKLVNSEKFSRRKVSIVYLVRDSKHILFTRCPGFRPASKLGRIFPLASPCNRLQRTAEFHHVSLDCWRITGVLSINTFFRISSNAESWNFSEFKKCFKLLIYYRGIFNLEIALSVLISYAVRSIRTFNAFRRSQTSSNANTVFSINCIL